MATSSSGTSRAPMLVTRCSPVRLSMGVALGLFVAIASGCERRNAPELLTLTEVTPSEVDIGERVDVLGLELPSGEVHEARVTFRGSLARPGRALLVDQVIEVDGAQVSPDRVTFTLTDALAERFTGRGEDAIHTTFRGGVEVTLPSAPNATPVSGTLKGETTLDFVPRPARASVVEDRERETKASLEFLGLELKETEGSQGAVVVSVAEGSPAAKAGVLPDDRIVGFEGVHVRAPSDILPSGTERAPEIRLVRGEEHLDKAIDIEGYRSDATRDLLGAVLLLGALALVIVALGLPPARALSWFERRLERGIMRHRRESGSLPARASGFIRSIIRGEASSGGALATLAPFIVFVGVSATFAIIPFVELRRRAELDVGVLYLLSVTSLFTMALITGGWDAERSWTPMAGLRAALRVLVGELPAAAAICAVVLLNGSLRLHDLTLAQVGTGGAMTETGSWPWTWAAVRSPQLFLLFSIFFGTVLVEGQRATALVKADARGSKAPDLASSDNTTAMSVSSLRRAAFFFAEWSSVFLMCGIASALFLGGWYLPGVSAQEHEASGSLQFFGALLFLVKSWALVGLVIAGRAALPKLRAELVLGFGLRYVTPIAFLCLGVTALEAAYPLVPTVELMVSLVTLAASVALFTLFVFSLRRGVALGRAKTSVNAFL